MNITENLTAVRERISRAGRDPDDITIVAVTKGFEFSVCLLAIQAGLRNLGENRVQEALDKIRKVEGADWHLIGHLQTNKVKFAANHFALIQSVDSLRLAETLARVNPRQHVLIEVNVAREAQKSGVFPDSAPELIGEAATLLDVQGVMAMGPTRGDPAPAFKELRTIRDAAQERLGKTLPILSMGMSGDYEIAVKEGSTMVRLGQALFGARPS